MSRRSLQIWFGNWSFDVEVWRNDCCRRTSLLKVRVINLAWHHPLRWFWLAYWLMSFILLRVQDWQNNQFSEHFHFVLLFFWVRFSDFVPFIFFQSLVLCGHYSYFSFELAFVILSCFYNCPLDAKGDKNKLSLLHSEHLIAACGLEGVIYIWDERTPSTVVHTLFPNCKEDEVPLPLHALDIQDHLIVSQVWSNIVRPLFIIPTSWPFILVKWCLKIGVTSQYGVKHLESNSYFLQVAAGEQVPSLWDLRLTTKEPFASDFLPRSSDFTYRVAQFTDGGRFILAGGGAGGTLWHVASGGSRVEAAIKTKASSVLCSAFADNPLVSLQE